MTQSSISVPISGLFAALLAVALPAQAQTTTADTLPTLGVEEGVLTFSTPELELELLRASQTVAALRPAGEDGFDFTPSDWLDRRSRDGYVHLGDLSLRLRWGSSPEWRAYSSATARTPVHALAVDGPTLAAADMSPTFPAEMPLGVIRAWSVEEGVLTLRYQLTNRSDAAVEIGALGIPMVFNNILTDRSLDEAHAVASFHDPYIGMDGGYLQVTRLKGEGSALLVVPTPGTPFEAYSPLLDEPTRRGITFEGFHEWMAHSRAFAEREWSGAEPWNPPTSATLAPGERRSYALRFLLAPSIREIEETLARHERPVAIGVPGYVVPMDVEARLFLGSLQEVHSLTVDPPGALTLESDGRTAAGFRSYRVRGHAWGRARLTVEYDDGSRQTVHYKVIKPATEVVDDLGRFLTNEQWFEERDDPFGRSPSVISYDYEEGRAVTEDNRAWIAGLGDRGRLGILAGGHHEAARAP